MSRRISRHQFGDVTATVLAGATILRRAHADEPLRLRVSLDTSPTHGRNVSIADYLKKLEALSTGTYRANMMHLQIEARKTMQSKGVTFYDPTAEQIAANREMLTAAEGQLIKDAKLSPEIVRLVREDVGAGA
jgi:hypothetical protein